MKLLSSICSVLNNNGFDNMNNEEDDIILSYYPHKEFYIFVNIDLSNDRHITLFATVKNKDDISMGSDRIKNEDFKQCLKDLDSILKKLVKQQIAK